MGALLAAIILSAGIMVAFKLFERFKIDILQAITVNYLVAALCGFIPLAGSIDLVSIPDNSWFPYAIAVGCTLILAFNVFALSAQKVGLALTAISSKMSVVIPVSLGILVFGETLTPLRLTGIIAALAAFWLTFYRKDKKKIELKYFILPVLLFIGNGSNDSILKIAQENFIKDDYTLFLATAFSMSLLIGIIIMLARRFINKRKFMFRNLIAGIILGLLNWGSTLYFLKGLSYFDVSVFVPVFNVSIVSLSALIGLIMFKEKLRTINWIGIALAVLAIFTIAMG